MDKDKFPDKILIGLSPTYGTWWSGDLSDDPDDDPLDPDMVYIRSTSLKIDNPENKSYDTSIHTNGDAMAWANFFAKHYTFPDKDTMLGWFANAMMAMHDSEVKERRDKGTSVLHLVSYDNGRTWQANDTSIPDTTNVASLKPISRKDKL